MTDSPRIEPMQDWVLVRKCTAVDKETDENGATVYRMGDLHVPDNYGERTNFATVLRAGPKARSVQSALQDSIKAEMKLFALCPEFTEDLVRVADEDFLVREHAILTLVTQ